MKKRTVGLMAGVLVLLLCACSQKEEDLGDSYIFGQDSQYYFNNQEALAESEDSYYLFGDGYLFSKSKENGEITILCDKPDCLHDHETDMTRQADCNAYYGNGSLVYYYHNKLYIITQESDIGKIYSAVYEADLTGSTREKILEPKEYGFCSMIHRGYLYISFSDFLEAPEVYEENEEKRENSRYRVDRYNLNGNTQKAETIFEKSGEFGQINGMKAYGNKIHMAVSSMEGVSNLIYDIQSKTTEEFPEKIAGDLTFFNGNILYHRMPGNDEKTYFERIEAHRDEKAILADGKGHQVDTVNIPISHIRFANDDLIANDNQYEVLYVNAEPNERAVQIYDKDGNFMKEIKLGNESLPALGMNKDYYFYLKTSKNQSGYEIWAVDLHRLDEENLEGEPFFAYVNPTEVSGNEIQ